MNGKLYVSQLTYDMKADAVVFEAGELSRDVGNIYELSRPATEDEIIRRVPDLFGIRIVELVQQISNSGQFVRGYGYTSARTWLAGTEIRLIGEPIQQPFHTKEQHKENAAFDAFLAGFRSSEDDEASDARESLAPDVLRARFEQWWHHRFDE